MTETKLLFRSLEDHGRHSDLEASLYYLSSIFSHSERYNARLSKLRSEGWLHKGSVADARQLEFGLVCKSLSNFAFSCRKKLEMERALPKTLSYVKSSIVGVIEHHVGGELRKQDLYFYDALHKVVHGVEINFDLKLQKDFSRELTSWDELIFGVDFYLLPRIFLYGSNKRVGWWRAIIEMEDFIDTATRLVRH